MLLDFWSCIALGPWQILALLASSTLNHLITFVCRIACFSHLDACRLTHSADGSIDIHQLFHARPSLAPIEGM